MTVNTNHVTTPGTKVTVAQCLARYFNAEGDTGSLGGQVTLPNGTVLTDLPEGVSAKRDSKAFIAEMKGMSTAEKRELAEGVCAVTGWTLV